MKFIFRILILFILIQLNSLALAKERCDSLGILKKICGLFIENRDKPQIRTSDGGFVENPVYRNIQMEKQKTTRKVSSSKKQYIDSSDIAQDTMEFEIAAEDILTEGEPLSWSRESKRLLTSANNLLSLLSSVYVDEKSFDWARGMPVNAPSNRRDSKSRVIAYTEDQLKELVEEIGADKIQKLKKKYDELKTRSVVSGDSQKIQGGITQAAHRLRKESLEDSRKRQKQLFDHAKNSITNMIKDGRSDSDLTPEQKVLLARVEKVQLQYADHPDSLATVACKDSMPNASFNPITETVHLCNNILDSPNAAILKIIGHEIGHAIDPCRASCSHVMVDTAKLRRFDSAENLSPAVMYELAVFKKGYQSIQGKIRLFSEPGQMSPELRELLLKEGIFTYDNPPLPLEIQPFDHVRSCLVNENKIDDITEQDLDIAVKLKIDTLKRLGQPLENIEPKEIRSRYAKSAVCQGVDFKQTEVNEAMADMYGNYALREYLKEFPLQNKNDLLAIDAHSTIRTCDYVSTQETISTGLTQNSALHKTHPFEHNRVKNLTLEFPGIAEHFDCEFKSSHGCFSRFTAPQKSQTSGTTSQSGATK
ncbi:MAG: hypothetical protein ACK5V3_08705 [Bdellovibrionales bacterium]